MKKLTHNDIRNLWFKYFEENGHKVYESAPLVPINDDSILWINAGVTPLKKYFDGTEIPDSRRIVNIQKCIRTNDIENVGITKRHQTFFEMMGNFSVGDYFKKEAIHFAFELLTSPEYFDIDKDLLYVTVYSDDEEAKKYWINEGLAEDHIVPLEGNFWEIGEGPCGPDSEIFFDRGEEYETEERDALKRFKNDEEQERYVEIWNNVFSQFNSEEGKERSEYKELPSKNIDTGAGLERWCCIFQGVDSNFETDLFKPIIEHIEDISKVKYTGQKEFKIIADHIRAITFAISDGATFDNVGRGYVLRRLLRRSVRFGKNLGIEGPFMYKLVDSVIKVMQEAYPDIVEKALEVKKEIIDEEELFLKTLSQGEKRLQQLIDNCEDNYISGEETFKLYDTYGFPYELTEEYLQEAGIKTSKEEFDKYMNIQKEMAKASTKNISAMASQHKVLLDFKKESTFVYNLYRLKTKVIGLIKDEKEVDELSKEGLVVLERTCFYAEQGGQVADTGMLIGDNFKARVLNVIKGPNGQNIHKIKILDGTIKLDDKCEVVIDKEKRKDTEVNHSMVHILQYALQQVVSNTIKQAGSYVDDKRLRFDFTYNGKMTDEKILETEEFANEYISKNLIVSTEILPIEKAKQLGAMALFGEKYGDLVRVVKIGKSIEFCGGTHTSNTKNIKAFAITNVESKGSNVYRIEGTTNDNIEPTLFNILKPFNDEIVKLELKSKEILSQARKEGLKLDFKLNIDKVKPTSYKDIIFIKNELKYVQEEIKKLEKEYYSLKEKDVLENLDIYKEHEKEINGINTIIMKTNNKDKKILKSIADSLVNNKSNIFVFFANVKDDSVNLIARSESNISAGDVIKYVSTLAGGNGGGKPTFAEGGIKDSSKTDDILEEVENYINGK